MTKEEIAAKIAGHKANIEECDVIITRFEGYGASWALDSREMRIAQHSRGHSFDQIQKLRATLEEA